MQYSKHLLHHYAALELNTARFLWKRIPKEMKEAASAKGLVNTWTIGKALTKREYASALKQLDEAPGIEDAEVKKLYALTARILREHHILGQISKAFSAIALDRAKFILGVNDAQVKKIFEQKGIQIKGKYAYPTMQVEEQKQFELNEERIVQMAKIVQFLEDLIAQDLERSFSPTVPLSMGSAVRLIPCVSIMAAFMTRCAMRV